MGESDDGIGAAGQTIRGEDGVAVDEGKNQTIEGLWFGRLILLLCEGSDDGGVYTESLDTKGSSVKHGINPPHVTPREFRVSAKSHRSRSFPVLHLHLLPYFHSSPASI